jgi:hypothetical protein
MKKIIGSLLVVTLVVLNFLLVPTKVMASGEEGRVDCYSQYDDGTTHFVFCFNCSPVTGTNQSLLDKCKP